MLYELIKASEDPTAIAMIAALDKTLESLGVDPEARIGVADLLLTLVYKPDAPIVVPNVVALMTLAHALTTLYKEHTNVPFIATVASGGMHPATN